MSLESFAQRIAAKTYFKELSAARALGYSGVNAYTMAFRAMDAVYLACFAADRPLTLTRFRPMGTK